MTSQGSPLMPLNLQGPGTPPAVTPPGTPRSAPIAPRGTSPDLHVVVLVEDLHRNLTAVSRDAAQLRADAATEMIKGDDNGAHDITGLLPVDDASDIVAPFQVDNVRDIAQPLPIDVARDAAAHVAHNLFAFAHVNNAHALSEPLAVDSHVDVLEYHQAVLANGSAHVNMQEVPVSVHIPPPKCTSRLLGLLSVVFYTTVWVVLIVVHASVYLLRSIVAMVKYPVIIVLVAQIAFSLIPQTTMSPRAAEVITTGLCTVPGMPFCPSSPGGDFAPGNLDCVSDGASDASTLRMPSPNVVDFPSLMATQSRALNALLTHSAAGSELALGVKHAELAVQDLLYLIRTSSLARKMALAQALEEFAQEAKVAGRHLQRLTSKLDGAVDTVLAFNEFAVRVLDETRQPGAINRRSINVIQSALNVLASQVADVEADGTIVVTALDALEDRLAILQALSEQELLSNGVHAEGHAASFWSAIIGDTPECQQLAYRLKVLDDIDSYRRRSVVYITATTQTLVMIEADVSELHRKLVAQAHPSTGELPIDVQLASIERSARRLLDEKFRRDSQIGISDGTSRFVADGLEAGKV